MKKPWYQRLLTSYLTWIVAGFLLLGPLLDIIVSGINLITFKVAWAVSLILILAYFGLTLLLSISPKNWLTDDDQLIRVKSLGIKPLLMLVGVLLALWIPPFLNRLQENNSEVLAVSPSETPAITPQIQTEIAITELPTSTIVQQIFSAKVWTSYGAVNNPENLREKKIFSPGEYITIVIETTNIGDKQIAPGKIYEVYQPDGSIDLGLSVDDRQSAFGIEPEKTQQAFYFRRLAPNAPDGTYTIKVTLINWDGTTLGTVQGSFRVDSRPSVPNAPTNLTLTCCIQFSATSRGIDLRWQDNSDKEWGFYVEWESNQGHSGTIDMGVDTQHTYIAINCDKLTWTISVRAFSPAGQSDAVSESIDVPSCSP